MSFDLPPLPNDWKYLALNECAQKQSISYGIVQPGTHENSGIPVIRVNNFKDNRLDLSDVLRVTPEIESKYQRTRLSGGEVLLTLVGSVGQVTVAPIILAGFNVARAVAVIHPLPHIEAQWIALCLSSPLSQHILASRANTTVQTTINLKDLRELPIPIAPKDERKNILDIMCALDNRISLLRETNTTLEAIAQTLFKSWFVDFDPVKAKAEGRLPEGMDEATAALFPSEFEESVLGLIPKGWRVGLLSQVADVIMGQSPDGSTYNEDGVGMPLVNGPVEFGSFHPEKTKWTSAPTRLSKANDLIVCVRGSTTGKYVKSDGEYCMGRGVCAIRGLNKNQPFVDLLFHFNINRLLSLATGSTFPSWNGPVLKNYTIVIPPLNIQHEFSNILKPIFDATSLNAEISKNLTSIRDTLLPRLISGQLRLNQAQEIMDEVGA